MRKIKIFYHNVSENVPCPDGLAAAWVCRRAFQGGPYLLEFVGCEYQKSVPQVDPGDFIYIVDFSFPVEVLEQWKAIAHGLVLIDHHEAKMRELLGIQPLQSMIHFDNSKCGALLTWEYLFPDKAVPPFLRYIDDRDRWQHLLPFTHEIHAATGKLGRTFEVFDILAKLSQEELITLLGKLGADALEERRQKIEEIAKRHSFQYWLDGNLSIPTVKLDVSEGWATSDVCSLLYKQYPDAPFVACVTTKPDGCVVWSLRSDPHGNNTDVAAIAQQFGGGGHRNAAGFRVDYTD